MQTATDAGLLALRAARQQDNDLMEMAMLQKKVILNQEHANGILSEKEYQDQLSILSKQYNEDRGVVNDTYRLEELQMEKENAAQSQTIAVDREAALTVIKTNEATAIAGIEVKKNADLQTAQTQYSQITQTDFQTLTAAILSLKNNESTQVTAIENKKNADLKTAADQYTDMQTAHYNTLVALANEKANAIAESEKAAAQAKKRCLGIYRSANQRGYEYLR